MENDIDQILQPSELLKLMDLDLNRIVVEPDVGSILEYELEIKANEFIKFAELDLQQNTDHGLVNALSNAKRAIDCQVDTILGCFGLLSRRSFPQKLEILHEMGIVTPRIVNKVVKARNYLEHEFKKPENEQVEDAVDIATLFVISLEKAIDYFYIDFSIGTRVDGVYDEGFPFSDKRLVINYDEKNRRFNIRGVIFDEPPTPRSRKAHRIERTIISPKEKGYLELIRLANSLRKSFSEEELTLQAIQLIQLLTTKAT